MGFQWDLGKLLCGCCVQCCCGADCLQDLTCNMHSSRGVMQAATTQACICVQLADMHFRQESHGTAVIIQSQSAGQSAVMQGGEEREEKKRRKRYQTCSIRSTWRVMQAVMPNSSSTSSEASLLMELVLTMLLRLALDRLYISCRPDGLLGSSMPPLLLLVGGGGDLEVLPCTGFSFSKQRVLVPQKVCFVQLLAVTLDTNSLVSVMLVFVP